MNILNHCLRNCLLLAVLFASTAVVAQTTGSFDATITFNGQSRTLSMYVPLNYNSSNQYPVVVCLHGAGDNSINYRNALINSLALHTFVPNTIIVCPDGGSDQAHDFYTPAGDEAIIDSAINYAVSNYNINTNIMTLQGFSLGGRSALKYGLDHPVLFKGLMLNTPAVQGVKDALSSAGINYSNASQLPIYITHGGTDILYTSPIDTVYEKLVLNDGIVRLVRYPALGHTIPPIGQIPGFPTWFTSPIPNALDLDVVRIIAPARLCSASTPISVLVRNAGSTPINSVNLQYKAGSNIMNHTWTGSLSPYQHAIITLPNITASAGNQNLEVSITSLNNSLPDTVIVNNQQIQPYSYANQAMPLPFTEGFEGPGFPPQGWIANRAGDAYSLWDYDNTVSQSGTSSMFAFNTILIFDNSGRTEEIISPLLNLQSITNPGVSFDVAFNYHRYTPPYFVDTTDFADTLEVYISTDCGDHYQRVYKKGGADLATFSQPILNPLTINATYAVPTANNWRNESIDLSSFAASNQALVKFSYRSALGGSINIDNIRFHNTLNINEPAASAHKVYPNPASGVINIDAGSELIKQILLIDISGKAVLILDINAKTHSAKLNVSQVQSGFYTLRTKTDKGTGVQKLFVQN